MPDGAAAAVVSAVEVVTFGCRLNGAESAVMQRRATEVGLTDTIIFNTCAVTASAVREARQSIRRMRKARPGARLLVTGCAAETEGAPLTSLADAIIPNAIKLQRGAYDGSGVTALTAPVAEFGAGNNHTARTRAFLAVQNGCDHRCTFCIIPYGRGASRSVPVGDVIAAAQSLATQGAQEIVLTGVDIASYDNDGVRLGKLVKQLVAAVPDVPRLRLSSLDPAAIDEDLWDVIATEPRFMPYLHLSLQAGEDLTLKRMKRRHNRADVVALCARARALRPGMGIGADIIAGFPTETDEMFATTLALVNECRLAYLHVFPYSPRLGTPAVKMPQVPPAVAKDRAAQLRAAGQAQRQALATAQIGRPLPVLTEQGDIGHTENFLPVKFDMPMVANRIIMAQITAATDGVLQAAPC